MEAKLSIAENLKHVILNNGIKMPLLGLGTFELTGSAVKKAIKYALDIGYRHIDTAKFYQNETEVGQAVKEYLSEHPELSRKDIFITSKLWYTDQGYDNALKAFNATMQRLGMDYLDLYLIHWPGAGNYSSTDKRNEETRHQSWKALEKLYEDGKVKAIGVSNFTISHLQKLLKVCKVRPQVNQVEYHPKLYQKKLLDYCKSVDIELEAYSSFAKGELLSDKVIVSIAKKYGKTPAQIILRWVIQRGVVVIPKATSKERIEENYNIYGFEISEEDMKTLDDLNEDYHCTWDPTNVI